MTTDHAEPLGRLVTFKITTTVENAITDGMNTQAAYQGLTEVEQWTFKRYAMEAAPGQWHPVLQGHVDTWSEETNESAVLQWAEFLETDTTAADDGVLETIPVLRDGWYVTVWAVINHAKFNDWQYWLPEHEAGENA